jgi:hypothetical protein
MPKKVSMFLSEAINVPVLELLETWRISRRVTRKQILHLWKRLRNLEDLDVAFLEFLLYNPFALGGIPACSVSRTCFVSNTNA